MKKFNKKPLTKNISLDTSFFEQNNFLIGGKIKELSELCAKKIVNVFITDITYREVISRFSKNLNSADENIKKPLDLLKSNGKVFRNFKELDHYFEFPKIEVETLLAEFLVAFDDWLKINNITIVKTGHITIKEVFNDYFNEQLPFGKGKKKSEFPDAFTLKALEEYFSGLNEITYVISGDNDILKMESKVLKPIKDESKLFDLIIRSTPEKIIERAIKMFELEFENSKNKLEEETTKLLIDLIEEEVNTTHMIDEIEVDTVDHVEVGDIEFNKLSIVSINTNDHSAKFICDIRFSFEVAFSADDFSGAWYDKEDDIYHFVEPRNYKFQDTYDIPITLKGYFDLDEEFAELEVEEINYGKRLDVVDSFKPWKHQY